MEFIKALYESKNSDKEIVSYKVTETLERFNITLQDLYKEEGKTSEINEVCQELVEVIVMTNKECFEIIEKEPKELISSAEMIKQIEYFNNNKK